VGLPLTYEKKKKKKNRPQGKRLKDRERKKGERPATSRLNKKVNAGGRKPSQGGGPPRVEPSYSSPLKKGKEEPSTGRGPKIKTKTGERSRHLYHGEGPKGSSSNPPRETLRSTRPRRNIEVSGRENVSLVHGSAGPPEKSTFEKGRSLECVLSAKKGGGGGRIPPKAVKKRKV